MTVENDWCLLKLLSMFEKQSLWMVIPYQFESHNQCYWLSIYWIDTRLWRCHYCTGCQNVSHYQQQSYSGLLFTMKRLLGSNLLQCFICCRRFQMHILLTVSSVMCALQLWVSSTHISSFMHRWLSSYVSVLKLQLCQIILTENNSIPYLGHYSGTLIYWSSI